MLPPPKESNSQSISSALRTNDTKVNVIQQSKLDVAFESDEENGSDDNDQIKEGRNFTEITQDRLVNKDEFYRA